jgi:hypothetical protein
MAEGNVVGETTTDLRVKHARQLAELKDAHAVQIRLLQEAITEERKETALTQRQFEQTLHIKYDHLLTALQEKVKAENEAKLERALDDLEKSARKESERARQLFEAQQAAEAALSVKFKGIVADLRKSWEEEEISRARQLEERLRAHYSTVLEHMEAQLQMALQLQDEADKQWTEDIKARNRQQLDAMRLFEAKCRRLYDTRLQEYVQKTDQQIAEYETQLLQVGSTLALERGRLEGRHRRMKLACYRWRSQYQQEVDGRYRELISTLEDKYLQEISAILEASNNATTYSAPSTMPRTPRQSSLPSAKEMRMEIQRLSKENHLTHQDTENLLGSLLDATSTSAILVSQYEHLVSQIKSGSGGTGVAARSAHPPAHAHLSHASSVKPASSSRTTGTPATTLKLSSSHH